MSDHGFAVRLRGKVVIVTGGASGIGAALCSLVVQEGGCVAVLDQNSAEAESVAASFGGAALALPVDVTDELAVNRGMQACLTRFGAIDGLVNSAGIAIRRSATELDDADWKRVIDVNLRGSFLCSKHAIPHMQAGSSIVHIASVVGITGVRSRAAYSASKGGVVALTRSMAMDYAGSGIRVNCVCPGYVRTPFTAALFADAERKARLTALHPLGRLGEPADIAPAILFLLSHESSWITGQAIAVDGGFSAGSTADI
jgi:meso-butanediol dehydrogenase / (S,S)-butanediol dehydrogenase / diacetyl reductase